MEAAATEARDSREAPAAIGNAWFRRDICANSRGRTIPSFGKRTHGYLLDDLRCVLILERRRSQV
jgi:hypothetical protein